MELPFEVRREVAVADFEDCQEEVDFVDHLEEEVTISHIFFFETKILIVVH